MYLCRGGPRVRPLINRREAIGKKHHTTFTVFYLFHYNKVFYLYIEFIFRKLSFPDVKTLKNTLKFPKYILWQ